MAGASPPAGSGGVARRAVELGAGEIVLNSIDADGTRAGSTSSLPGGERSGGRPGGGQRGAGTQEHVRRC